MALRNNLIAAFFLSLGIASNAQSDDDGTALFWKVTEAAQECVASTNNGTDAASCYIKATPKKCQQQVITFLSSTNKNDARRAWYFCVASCASSGFWSNRFGECSREVR